MPDLVDLPVRELITLMASNQVSSEEICAAFLTRISESASINAVVHTDSHDVLQQARNADAQRKNGNKDPLLGIPFSVKDSIAVAGWPWRSGSHARADVIAKKDATTVARLRSQGAIVLCKTTTPEYTWSAQTNSDLHGRTNNPYDLARSSGGSSGGEAALHAVHGAPFGLGSDGFNSIRVPAHFCGSVGLRPTSGVVSEAGTWPTTKQTGMLDISTIGPMGRYAQDLDLLLMHITGCDPDDPFVHPLGHTAYTNGGSEETEIAVRGFTIGILPERALSSVTPGTRIALDLARDVFRGKGAHIMELEPWDTSLAVDIAFGLMAPDGGALARANLEPAQGRHTAEFRDLLDSLQSRKSSIDEYLNTMNRLREYRTKIRRSIAGVDIALVPVASGPAPLHDRLPGSDSADYDVEGFAQSFAIALSGMPSAVVPVYMEADLPVGIQLVGNPHRDFTVLTAARSLQNATAANILPPQAWT